MSAEIWAFQSCSYLGCMNSRDLMRDDIDPCVGFLLV